MVGRDGKGEGLGRGGKLVRISEIFIGKCR